MRQTADGGYVTTGETNQFGLNSGNVWVMRLDGAGNIIWQKTLGADENARGVDVQETSNGGFVVAATIDTERTPWVIKLDAGGVLEWQLTAGELNTIRYVATAIRETPDGGFVVAGYDSNGPAGSWLMKLDGDGQISWQRQYAVGFLDEAYDIEVTSDGGFVLSGIIVGAVEGDECFGSLLRLDGAGDLMWERAYRYSAGCRGFVAVDQVADGGYVATGLNRNYDQDRDIDLWKVNPNGDISSCPHVFDTDPVEIVPVAERVSISSSPVSSLAISVTTTVTPTASMARPAYICGSKLAISKRGPAEADPGAPVTYTLQVTSSASLELPGLVITDRLPFGATHIGGGTLVGSVVSWTVPSLAPGDSITRSFSVAASTTITNSDYGVLSAIGHRAAGERIVVTIIEPPVATATSTATSTATPTSTATSPPPPSPTAGSSTSTPISTATSTATATSTPTATATPSGPPIFDVYLPILMKP